MARRGPRGPDDPRHHLARGRRQHRSAVRPALGRRRPRPRSRRGRPRRGARVGGVDPAAPRRRRRRGSAGRCRAPGRGPRQAIRTVLPQLQPRQGCRPDVRQGGSLGRRQGVAQDVGRRSRAVDRRAGPRPRAAHRRRASRVGSHRRDRQRGGRPAALRRHRRARARGRRRDGHHAQEPHQDPDDQARGQGRGEDERGRPAGAVPATVAPARHVAQPHDGGDRRCRRRAAQPDPRRRRAALRAGPRRAPRRRQGGRHDRGAHPPGGGGQARADGP